MAYSIPIPPGYSSHSSNDGLKTISFLQDRCPEFYVGVVVDGKWSSLNHWIYAENAKEGQTVRTYGMGGKDYSLVKIKR